RILSPLRLPIPPLRQMKGWKPQSFYSKMPVAVKARARINFTLQILQILARNDRLELETNLK
ncbi:MAG: hypothetical protein LBK98_09070, partial [Peptococcaceae bacterium]|nr:hypothetical protein [Peptococcaceae bacterium]